MELQLVCVNNINILDNNIAENPQSLQRVFKGLEHVDMLHADGRNPSLAREVRINWSLILSQFEHNLSFCFLYELAVLSSMSLSQSDKSSSAGKLSIASSSSSTSHTKLCSSLSLVLLTVSEQEFGAGTLTRTFLLVLTSRTSKVELPFFFPL